MKKILLWAILASSLLLIVSETNALSYGGTNNVNYSLPNMNFSISGSSWIITPKIGLNQNGFWTVDSTLQTTVQTSLSCFRYTNSSTNGYLFSVGWGRSTEFSGVSYSLQNTSSGIALIDSSFVVEGDYQPIWSNLYTQNWDEVMLYMPSSIPAGGDNAVVVCIRPIFSHNVTEGSTYKGTSVYVYGNQTSSVFEYFIERNIQIRGVSFGGFQYTYGYVGYADGNNQKMRGYPLDPLPDSSVTGSLRTYTMPFTFAFVDVNPHDIFGIPAFLYGQNFNGIIDYQFNPTLPDFLDTNSTGAYIDPSSGGTGTVIPPHNYFKDCGSFLEIGCYVVGLWDSIVAKFNELLSYLFPKISFSGDFNSCGSLTSTGTTQSISQKFANIIILINPIPPSEPDQICTLYGIKNIEYQTAWPTQNMFAVYAPGEFPELESVDLRMAFGQTPIDLIIIFGMMSLIFYQKSNHD